MTTSRDPMHLDDAPLRLMGHRLHKVEDIEHAHADAQRHPNLPTPTRNLKSAPGNSPALRQVVLVDREIDALRDLAIALRDEYDFYITISGSEALNLLRSGAIDTIVVGQNLYSSTGLDVLAEARRLAPTTHRVLLANAVEATALQNGAPLAAPLNLLQRPCTVDNLRKLLEAATTQSKTQVIPELEIEANIRPNFLVRAPTDTHDPADFEHVVMETQPDFSGRKARAAASLIDSLPVIVYTDNAEFYRTISLALQDHHTVRLCTQLERAAEFAEMGQCPLLITDRPGTQVELQRIAISLRAVDAGIIMIAAGTPEVGSALRKLLGTGALHSFLTKPISVPLARLAVESGKRQYLQTKALQSAQPQLTTSLEIVKPARAATSIAARRSITPTGPAAPSYFIPTDPNRYSEDEDEQAPDYRIVLKFALGIICIIAAAVGGWYLWQRHTAQTTAVHIPQSNLAASIAINMQSAQKAFADGRFAVPSNNSALFYYMEALKLAPQNPAAKQGLEQTLERIIEQAEKALLNEQFDVAADAIATVRAMQPQNRRLPFLEGQLSKEHKRLAAREASRNAANKIIASEPIGPINNETQRREAVNRWLILAKQRMLQNRLTTPENDNAEFYLRQAERADPENTVVKQSLRDIGTRLMTQADEALSRQQLDFAKSRAAEAVRFGADELRLERLRKEMESITTATLLSNYLNLTLQRTRDNRLFEPEADSAKFYLTQLQRIDPASVEAEQATRALALKLIENIDQAIAHNQLTSAAQLLSEVKRLQFSGPELAAVEIRLRATHTPPINDSGVSRNAAAVMPKPIKTVAPKFPAEAMRAGAQGWVDVGFHVATNGDIQDVAAVASSASNNQFKEQFERAAVAAIQQYKFAARDDNDATQRIVMRIVFKLD